MNLLFISNLDGRPWAGPTYSVPRQIAAQTAYDNVFWYNIRNDEREGSDAEGWKRLPYYHNLDEFPAMKISKLPEPFNRPDCVIVEEFYDYAKTPLLFELLFGSIPYIIIPRGELTSTAQIKKKVKKKMANAIIFKIYAQKAKAIYYLTEQEALESGSTWNKKWMVIPNGTEKKRAHKQNFSAKRIRCVSIGRIDPFQKGIDLLIDACFQIKEILRENNCVIDIYGPDRVNKVNELVNVIREKGMDDIICFHEAVYHQEKEDVLLNSDVFLMPSRFEGHPTALIDALSYGIPCLVTEGSNMKNEIVSAKAGWGADTTVDAIQTALCSMIRDRSKFLEMSNHALILSQEYDWEALALKAHNQFLSVLNN